MQPVAAARGWEIPAIESVGELAEWLSLSGDELEWFADLKGLGNKLRKGKLQHYHYRVSPKRSGGVRLIEMPKPRMKELQRRILSGILDPIPVHRAVHGFVKGRSIVSFAAPHAGRAVLLRLDLQDFFPGFPAARVQALFRTLGYPEGVADRLGGICTNAVPREVWNVRPVEVAAAEWSEARNLYGRPHLPQGAPTSPALANVMAYRLDCRLSGLAKTAGAVYTRYADDLGFSGDEEFEPGVERFAAHAAAIALEEGLQRQSPQVSYYAPGRSAATGGSGGEPEGESSTMRSGSAGGDSDELRPGWAGIAESREGGGLPRALAGPRRVRGDGERAAGSAAACAVRSHPVGIVNRRRPTTGRPSIH